MFESNPGEQMALNDLQRLKNACVEADKNLSKIRTEVARLNRLVAEAESQSQKHTDAYVAALERTLLNDGNEVILDSSSSAEYTSALQHVHSNTRSLKRKLPSTFNDGNLPSLDNASSSDSGDIYQRTDMALTPLPTTLSALMGNDIVPVCIT